MDRETRLPKYHGQERVIASGQLQDAKGWATRRAGKDVLTREDVSASHTETGEHLVSRISDGDGVESYDLTIQESKTIAREAKKAVLTRKSMVSPKKLHLQRYNLHT